MTSEEKAKCCILIKAENAKMRNKIKELQDENAALNMERKKDESRIIKSFLERKK